MIPYFSHDIFARENLKIKRLMKKYKMEGYGIFWAVAEFLHNHGNKIKVEELDLLAMDIGAKKEKLEAVIFDFELFSIKNNVISSKRVGQNLKLQKEKSKKARESIMRRWQEKEPDTNVLRTNNERNTIKEKKEKETKVKEKKEEEKKSDETFLPCGSFNNVFLSPAQRSELLVEAKTEAVLNTVIDELSQNIALKKEKPFDEGIPDLHFVRVRRYIKQKLSKESRGQALQVGGKALEHIRKIEDEGGVPPPAEFFKSKEKLLKKLRGEQEK